MSDTQRGGDWGGGDRREEIECPLCGAEVVNQGLPDHLASDRCGGAQGRTDAQEGRDV